MRRPRVALLRGAYLGPFEAQNFEPLLDRLDLEAFVLPQNLFDLSDVRLPVTVSAYPDSRWLGGCSLINAWKSRVLGRRYPMPDVQRIVGRFDIVHTFEAWYDYTQQAAEACARLSVPLVVTHWDTLAYRGKLKAGECRRILKALETASCILAASFKARQALLEDGVPAAKIIVQSMGVDTDRFSPGARSAELAGPLGIQEQDQVVLFVGRWAADKGVRELVGAFRQACRRSSMDRAKLLLVGKGPEEGWLRSARAERDLQGRLLLAPPVPYREIHRWYQLADIFVFPCIPGPAIEEQFGYALVEAMATGLPIITSAEGGIPDVAGEAARILPPADVDLLAQTMAELLEDAGQRKVLGQLARQRALLHFSSRRVAERLLEIYLKLGVRS